MDTPDDDHDYDAYQRYINFLTTLNKLKLATVPTLEGVFALLHLRYAAASERRNRVFSQKLLDDLLAKWATPPTP